MSFLKTSISVDTAKKVALGWGISQKTYQKIKHTNTLIDNQIRSENLNVM